MAHRDYLVEEIAEDHAGGRLTRREALRRLALMGMSLPAAGALLAACGGDDDDGGAATTTTSSTAPARGDDVEDGEEDEGTITFAGLTAAYAAPEGEPRAAVLVIHENRGLTVHFHDLVSRFASEGYAALSVDLVSAEGGTASMDEGEVQGALAAAPVDRLLRDLGSGIDELQRRAPGVAVGVVGFCFGGAMTWNLLAAGDERIVAAVPFYGPAPADPDFGDAQAAVLAIYGGEDSRVNASRERAEEALRDAGLTYEIRTFDGAGHAFFNDRGERYDAEAASEAWALTLAWFEEHLVTVRP